MEDKTANSVNNKSTNNANNVENPKPSKGKDKGIMSVPQALSCLEVAMKWQTGFKKVFIIKIILVKCSSLIFRK